MIFINSYLIRQQIIYALPHSIENTPIAASIFKPIHPTSVLHFTKLFPGCCGMSSDLPRSSLIFPNFLFYGINSDFEECWLHLPIRHNYYGRYGYLLSKLNFSIFTATLH